MCKYKSICNKFFSKYTLVEKKNYFCSQIKIIMEKVSLEQAWKSVEKVQHPAINFSLKELGILKDIDISGDILTLTLALPFPEIPIIDALVNSLAEPLSRFDIEIAVETVLMTEQEKQRFRPILKEN